MRENYTKRNFFAPDSMWKEVDKIAAEKFDGNVSMAIRYLIRLGLEESKHRE